MVRLIKTIARNYVFPFLTQTGLVKVIASNASGNRIIVMFHGVVKQTDFELSVNHISCIDFERQIKYYSENFKIVSLSDIFNSWHEGDVKERLMAITFDDGYENNYTNAFPILQKYQAPATIFVVTKILESLDYVLWYDLIDLVKQKVSIDFFKSKAHLLAEHRREIIANSVNWNQLKDGMKKLDTKEKELILQRHDPQIIQTLCQGNKEYRNVLNKNQMLEMIESGLVEIGSHTHNHPNLDQISIEEAKIEIEYSKKLIEQTLNYKVKSVAFPDGAYNESVKELCLDAGFKNLLAVDYKLPSDQSDISILPRYCVSNTTTVESNIVQIYNSFRKKGF